MAQGIGLSMHAHLAVTRATIASPSPLHGAAVPEPAAWASSDFVGSGVLPAPGSSAGLIAGLVPSAPSGDAVGLIWPQRLAGPKEWRVVEYEQRIP